MVLKLESGSESPRGLVNPQNDETHSRRFSVSRSRMKLENLHSNMSLCNADAAGLNFEHLFHRGRSWPRRTISREDPYPGYSSWFRTSVCSADRAARVE